MRKNLWQKLSPDMRDKLESVQIKYPSNSSLFRFIGKKQFFTENDIKEIVELCSKHTKEKMENRPTTT